MFVNGYFVMEIQTAKMPKNQKEILIFERLES